MNPVLGAIRSMDVGTPSSGITRRCWCHAEVQSKALRRLDSGAGERGQRLLAGLPAPRGRPRVWSEWLDHGCRPPADRLFSILDPRRARLSPCLRGPGSGSLAVGPGTVISDLSDREGALFPCISAFTSSHRFSMTSNIYRLSRAITPEDGRPRESHPDPGNPEAGRGDGRR